MSGNHLLQPDPTIPRLALRPREAAKAIGVCERTLWAWTRDGAIPHVRHGKAVLYPVDALRRWLSERAATTAEAKVKDVHDVTNA